MSSSQSVRYSLEVCANSYQSAKNAQDGGADRIELCQNLEQGGITPSYGLIKRCKDTLTIPIHVLVRPRPGNFVYTDDEVSITLNDIIMCRQLGVAGVVIGVLRGDNTIDVTRTLQMVEAARPLHVTFHRAIEDCPDPYIALEEIIGTGCGRVLTTGFGATFSERLNSIDRLITQANGRIEVMAGGGVSVANISDIMEATRVKSFHASAKSKKLRGQGVIDSKFDVEEMESDTQQIISLLDKIRSTAQSSTSP